MADCDSRLYSWYGVEISADEILATAGKALAIDPNLAEAHAARGMALVNRDRVPSRFRSSNRRWRSSKFL